MPTANYAGMSAEDILQQMYSKGFTQEGINRVYELRGLANPPTLPANLIGGHVGAGRDSARIYGADGKPMHDVAARNFLNTVGTQAVDPYRERSGVSNLAGGILNGVFSYAGGPVGRGIMAAADYGNKALGNDDGTSYVDGKRTSSDQIGSLVGSVGSAMKGPGSYGASQAASQAAKPGALPSGAISESGAGGSASSTLGALTGIGGGGMAGSGSGSGGWIDTLIDVGGALLSANAAKDAGKTQGAGAAAAIKEEQRQYDLNREDLAPYRAAGSTAIGQLATGTADGGDFNRDFTMADFQKDPGYQFRMDEGSNAIQGANAATRGVQNGRTLAELTRYGQDYASGEYSSAYNRFNNDRNTRFNRLGSIAGIGQTATNTGIQAGANSTNNIADLTLQRANATAAGNIGAANAYTQGAESLANLYRNRKYGSADTNWIGG